MIKFDGFKMDVTEQELADARKQPTARLTAGDHELEILAAELKGPVQADPSWVRVGLVLGTPGTKPGADGKFKGVIYHNLMIPTRSSRYKGEIHVFRMLQDFFDGLGENLIPDTSKAILTKYFGEGNSPVGLKIKVKLGYKKPHIDYSEGKYVIKNRDGSLLVEGSFDTREAAEGQCFTDNIEIQRFMEVLRVYPGPKQREDAASIPTKPKQKASKDW